MRCEQCGTPCQGVPWVAMRQERYAYLCTPECLDKYQSETHRIAWTQGMLALGWRAVNGS